MADASAGAKPEAQWLAEISARGERVQALLKTSALEALRLALQDPPMGSALDAPKAENAAVVQAAMLGVREGETDGCVSALSDDECELLVKFVYRFLGAPSAHSAAWLRWHAALTARTGPGAIVRTIAETERTV